MEQEKHPAGNVLRKYWNELHDLSLELENVAHEYDVAASYVCGEGSDDATKVRDLINSVVEDIDILTGYSFDKLVHVEREFVKKHGSHDEYADKQRKEMYPR